MAIRTRTLIATILIILLIAGGFWWLSSTRNPGPSRATIDQLRQSRFRYDYDEKQKAAAELAKMGDDAIPSLAAALKAKDHALDVQYDKWRRKLSPDLQKLFPDRPSKDELRRAVAGSVNAIGPGASRALVGAIEHALEPNQGLENMELLRALYWSIPESPKAVQILSNWLAHPKPGLPLFGMKDAAEIWPAVSHLAPLLGEWLKLADTAGEAAEGLSLMGTNALFAIPVLIELADKGYVGGITNAQLHVSYTPELETNVLNMNRAASLNALGGLGRATPDILATLARNTTNSLPLLRVVAANAIGEIGPAAAPILPHVLSRLDESHSTVLLYQVEAIGKIGSAAKDAVPALLRFSDPAVASAIPAGEPIGRIVRWSWEPPALPLTAAVSLAQVDPTAAKVRLNLIVAALNGLLSSNAIVALRPLRADLLTKLIEDPKQVGPLLARNVLILDPGNSSAADALIKQMQPANAFEQRSVAARWYFELVRETNEVLNVFRETLPHVKDLGSQTPLNLVRELGPAGRELAPSIKPLLEHENRIMRMLAGKALRSIAPDEMPPVNED